MAEKINPLVLSYPNFVLGQIIDPDEANQNNSDITNKINEFIGEVEGAIEIAEGADTKADNAVFTANAADGKADGAVSTANSANTKADNAVSTANAADGKADTAVATAATALGQATVEPYTGALGAMKIVTDVKSEWDELVPDINEALADVEDAVDAVAGKVSTEQLNNAIVNAKNAVINEIDRKEPVETVDDLYTTYPDAEDGWLCMVKSNRNMYMYNSALEEWELRPTDLNYADDDGTDGIITSEKFVEWSGKAEQSDFETHLSDYVLQVPYAEATGSANTYAVTLNPAPSAYVDGMAIAVKINVNNTGASTININSLGAKTIKKPNGNDVSAGNLKAGSIYTMRYNGTNFILQGEGASGNATASDLLSGKTATTDVGEITGTMTNQGAKIITPGTTNQAIAKGYHSGSGYVKGDNNLVAENIKNGVSIFGVEGGMVENPFLEMPSYSDANLAYNLFGENYNGAGHHGWGLEIVTQGERFEYNWYSYNNTDGIRGFYIFVGDGMGDAYLYSEDLIDFTNWKFLSISAIKDYQDGSIFVVLSSSKKGSYTEYEQRWNFDYYRREMIFNLSQITGSKYLRIHMAGYRAALTLFRIQLIGKV